MTNSGNKVQTTSLNRADVETIVQLMIVDICSLLAHRRSLLQSIEAMKHHFGLSAGSVQLSNTPKLNFEYENFENRGSNGFSDSDFAAIKMQYDEKMSVVKGSRKQQKTTGCDSVPVSCFSKEAPVDINSCGSYEFSPELQFVARNRALHYAGLDVLNLKLAHKSAIIIQQAWRNHRLKKYFEKCFIHRRKQSLQSACSKPINFDQQLSLNKIPPPVPIRKHSGNRNPGTERTPDWTQTFAPDCGKDGLGPLLSESFTPPRSGALSFSRRNQAVTPDEEKVKKSCPSNVGMCPEAGLSNATYFGVPASVQGSHFPFPVNTTVCNNANKGHPNMVKGDGLQQPGVCNRSSNNSEHASTGSDEGIESAPASANSFINYDNYNQEEYSSPAPPQMPPTVDSCSTTNEAASLSTTAPYSMLSSTVTSHNKEPSDAATTHSNNSSLSSSSMLSHPHSHNYTGTTAQSTNCLSLSLPIPPHSDYENSRSLGGGSCGGLSPRIPAHTMQQQTGAKHFASQPSVLHQKSLSNSQNSYHFSAVPKTASTSSKLQAYLNENLVQLYNCKRTGMRYSPQQEMTIRIGMFLFNKDPKKGLKFLTEKRFLEPDSPGDVAYMLACYKRGLNKTRVGEYLASEKPFNCLVLTRFVELNRPRFEGKAIDEALRVFMTLFRLPGESQKIDRILMSFGHMYACANESVALMLSGAWADGSYSMQQKLSRGASAAHILSYAIMMLNTDLHNSNVRGNMSMKDFKRNCRGSEELKHLDDSFLEGIYKRIKASQFREPEDHSTAIAMFSSNLQNFNKNMLLDEPFRCLVAVCPFHVAVDCKNTKNIQEVYLFLFNDMLLAATREQSKKKLSKSQLPVDLATVLLQTFTYRFDIPLLHLNVDAFELTARPGVFAGNYDILNSFSWCLRVSQNGLFTCSSSGGGSPQVYDFFCSNYDDFLKFNNDLKIYVKDMTVIEQLRINDNLEFMYRPQDEQDRRQKELNGSYEGKGSHSSVTNGDFKSSRNKSNSVDSLLDPVGNNNNDEGLNTAALQRMLNSS